MSACFLVRLKPESLTIDVSMDGRSLASNEGALSARCEEQRATPLFAFLSPDSDQQRQTLDSLGMYDVPVAPQAWFDPTDGLRTFRVLHEIVSGEREWFREVDLLLEDLQRVIEILTLAEAAGHQWNLDVAF
jgi:hypothetical protein